VELLRADSLRKRFGGVHATRDVSFSVNRGEKLAIIGPNGAGKTTLFNLLSGFLFPSSGRVYFLGKDITRMKEHKRAHLGIARSFQITNLFSDLTVMENVLLALRATKPSRFQMLRPSRSYKDVVGKAHNLLAAMDLPQRKDTPVHAIAYGEKRKLEIALSLASEPKLLLLDEPSCGLTATESNDIINRIQQLGTDITVIIVAHDMDLVFGVAERILCLHFGEIIAEGTCDEIRNNSKVKEIYIGLEENACNA
jgi:branched-chain amino acid transport system ATP-binding protein